ncbi:hypothetical protein SUDANB178_07780 (plasmid) [Streptomyces sp. enrichment culture]
MRGISHSPASWPGGRCAAGSQGSAGGCRSGSGARVGGRRRASASRCRRWRSPSFLTNTVAVTSTAASAVSTTAVTRARIAAAAARACSRREVMMSAATPEVRIALVLPPLAQLRERPGCLLGLTGLASGDVVAVPGSPAVQLVRHPGDFHHGPAPRGGGARLGRRPQCLADLDGHEFVVERGGRDRVLVQGRGVDRAPPSVQALPLSPAAGGHGARAARSAPCSGGSGRRPDRRAAAPGRYRPCRTGSPRPRPRSTPAPARAPARTRPRSPAASSHPPPPTGGRSLAVAETRSRHQSPSPSAPGLECRAGITCQTDQEGALSDGSHAAGYG